MVSMLKFGSFFVFLIIIFTSIPIATCMNHGENKIIGDEKNRFYEYLTKIKNTDEIIDNLLPQNEVTQSTPWYPGLYLLILKDYVESCFVSLFF